VEGRKEIAPVECYGLIAFPLVGGVLERDGITRDCVRGYPELAGTSADDDSVTERTAQEVDGDF